MYIDTEKTFQKNQRMLINIYEEQKNCFTFKRKDRTKN